MYYTFALELSETGVVRNIPVCKVYLHFGAIHPAYLFQLLFL